MLMLSDHEGVFLIVNPESDREGTDRTEESRDCEATEPTGANELVVICTERGMNCWLQLIP